MRVNIFLIKIQLMQDLNKFNKFVSYIPTCCLCVSGNLLLEPLIMPPWALKLFLVHRSNILQLCLILAGLSRFRSAKNMRDIAKTKWNFQHWE